MTDIDIPDFVDGAVEILPSGEYSSAFSHIFPSSWVSEDQSAGCLVNPAPDTHEILGEGA